MRVLSFSPTFADWQKAARRALDADWEPESVLWEELGQAQPGLDLTNEEELREEPTTAWRVPKPFVEMAKRVACHRQPSRWSRLYRVLWRIVHGERHLLEIVVDPDIDSLLRMDKAIRREVHKMRAFVRFREVDHAGEPWFVAWFEPEHLIVELNAPFFVDRFAQMRWSILTPDRCAHWDRQQLTFTEGVQRSASPTEDGREELWLTYYSHIFNPARVKTKAMVKEMPRRYWKNLPEAAAIPDLLENAPGRVRGMHLKSEARQSERGAGNSDSPDLEILGREAVACRACPLYQEATQVVFGEGPRDARLLLVGEQPGDSEDLAGRPFVGPAGQLLDRALAEAGLDRSAAYLTNAVKHFKFERRGKRRIHQKPSTLEVKACHPWLRAELAAVQPMVLVCLGGTAALSIFGSGVRVLRDRGQFRESEFCKQTLITIHPSALLRMPDEALRAREYANFVADLRLVERELRNQ